MILRVCIVRSYSLNDKRPLLPCGKIQFANKIVIDGIIIYYFQGWKYETRWVSSQDKSEGVCKILIM